MSGRDDVRVEQVDDPRFAMLTAPTREYGVRIDPDTRQAAPPASPPEPTSSVVSAPPRADVHRGRRQARRLVAAGFAVPALIAAALGALLIASDSGSAPSPRLPPVSPAPPTFTIATAIRAHAPAAPGMAVAAAANGGLWYQRADGTLARLAASDGAVNYAFPTRGHVSGMAVSGRTLLVLTGSGAGSRLIVRDRGSGSVQQRIALPGTPACSIGVPVGCAPLASAGQVFVALTNGVARIQGGVAALTSVPGTVAAVAGSRHIWVLTAKTLVTVDPTTGRVRRTASLGGLVPSAITTTGGTVWVAGMRGDEPVVLRFDKPAGRPPLAIRLPAAPTGLAAAGGAIWVALAAGGVRELDPSRNALAGASVALPALDELLTARPDQLWAIRLDAGRATFTRLDLTPSGS